MDEIDSEPIDKIEFTKYLNCPDCIASGLYCEKHKKEVEEALVNDDD